MTSYRVLAYLGTTNLGDAVQTAALSRLLPGRLVGVYRHLAAGPASPRDGPFVVNGWLGDEAPREAFPGAEDCLFAGVFVGRQPEEQLRWMARSGYAVGARDPFTAEFLRTKGVESQMIGCATLTLEPYRGPRSGRYAVDWVQPDTTFLTNCLDGGTSWPRQWSMALQLLETLGKAEVVYTSRLHVALPCLAFGTPVVVPRRAVAGAFQPERFALLDALGFRYDEPFTVEVAAWADRYIRFLSKHLGREIRPGAFRFPAAPECQPGLQTRQAPVSAREPRRENGQAHGRPSDRPGAGSAVQAAFSLYRAGRRREAEAAYREILRREPDNADALHLLGQLAHECGQHRDAEILMRRAIELAPGAADFYNNLGALLKRTGRSGAAVALFRRAIALRPDSAEAHNNLGTALESLGEGDAAADAYRRAADLRPGYAGALTNLAAALEWLGQPVAATEVRRELVAGRPEDAQAHSDLLTGMLYHVGDDAEAVYAEHLRWAQRHEGMIREGQRGPDGQIEHLPKRCSDVGVVRFTVPPVPSPAVSVQVEVEVPPVRAPAALSGIGYSNVTHALTVEKAPSLTLPRSTEGGNTTAGIVSHTRDKRILRVGYVSPDFRAHPVVRFFAPLLTLHDRGQFAITCYSHVAKPDGITEQLRQRADHWRDIAAMDDDAAAELIRQDGIDILVDLCGHMPQNRLKLFARKPAPVQVAYLGYPTTTGMKAMDWRITDEMLDPRAADQHHTERLARIDGGCWCYLPDEQGPAVNELPGGAGRPFTFAMFNRLVKVMPDTVRLWGRIVSAVPGSRLLVLAAKRGDLQRSTLERFRQAGFPMDRLVPVGRRPRPEYMKLYQQADLSLDAFPYAGQTTTCDALWMGVPTVTLAGPTHVSRAGLAIMESVGLGEFVAYSPEQYVAIATKRASERARLKELRAGLRMRMSHSPLCDPRRLTRGIESAFRGMAWQ